MKTTVLNLIVLDESGSMNGITQQTIDGCNETINTIKSSQEEFKDSQEHFVSIYAFQSNDQKPSHYLIKGVAAKDVNHITNEDYEPWGGTPLYDAVGATLADLRAKARQYEASVGSVTIITDGYENASREYTHEKVRKMISELKEMGWNFNFIGANIDVERAAQDFGINNYMAFEQSEEGTRAMFEKEARAKMRYFKRMQKTMADESDARPLAAKLCSFSNHYYDEAERITPSHIRQLAPNEVFVFGSNLEGMHAGGAARTAAEKFGAVMGQGVGLQGQSYAIPTMQGGVDTIKPYVDEFIEFAKAHPELKFLVTRIGCGIAGFKDSEIAPLFREALNVENIYLPKQFLKELK